jgi:hypothetical protein
MPLYPSIVLRARERAPTPCSSVVFNLGLTFESVKELGARHIKLTNSFIYTNQEQITKRAFTSTYYTTEDTNGLP